LSKPEKCKGCPLYQSGEGFVPDEIIEGSEVFVLGQNPGEEEERQGKPFVGKTGQVMVSRYFPAAGLRRGENVSIGNTLRCRWKGGNTLPTGKLLSQAVVHCNREYLRIPISTRLVVSQGALAAKFLARDDKLSIEKWRGFLLPNEYQG
jgi:uracil-DNA glycosylase